MPEFRSNPFDVTKAVDFSDEQIAAYFVDMPGAGFATLANPKSPMPMLIRGGKGSGKTHLMRYFSYPLQKLRYGSDFIRGIKDEGYLGIYFRCGGLNAARFRGKNQSEDVWISVFSYYMELWLGQLVLACASDFLSGSGESSEPQRNTAQECVALLDDHSVLGEVLSFTDLAQKLHGLQRELDIEINNCALTHRLNVRIRATPGRIVFGIPQVLSSSHAAFKAIQFLYLLDEYENLTEPQQRYVNTLLREKELPCSFKIGGRIYGFKTFKTYSDEEDIKDGSEYEVLPLDARLRDNRQYRLFAELLCAKRLLQAGYVPANSVDTKLIVPMLYDAFEVPESSTLLASETSFVASKYRDRERPYFSKLRERLKEGVAASVATGVQSVDDINLVIHLLECPDYPLLEKINVFRLYQSWRTSENLKKDAREIADQCRAYLAGDRSSEYSALIEKRKGDMLAQLLRECDQKQSYVGFDTFVEMSEGLPRNLLVILKSIFNWATFNGENAFSGGKISAASQREGVREAAEWFFDDARMPGDDGSVIRAGVGRLATLFREVRFSDKPSEKSVCTFSVDLSECSPEAQRILKLAEKWSLLIGVTGGQRDRNTMRVDDKYYINSMLAPKWDLSVSRGGALELNPEDVNAIFDPASVGSFNEVLRERIERMTAPFFGTRRRPGNGQSSSLQPTLPLNR